MITSPQEWGKYMPTPLWSFCKHAIPILSIFYMLIVRNVNVELDSWPYEISGPLGSLTRIWDNSLTAMITLRCFLFFCIFGLLAIPAKASLLCCISNAKWKSWCPLYLLNGFHFNLRKMYWRSCVWHGKCVYLRKIATCLLELQYIMYNAAFSCTRTFSGILLCQRLESLHKHW